MASGEVFWFLGDQCLSVQKSVKFSVPRVPTTCDVCASELLKHLRDPGEPFQPWFGSGLPAPAAPALYWAGKVRMSQKALWLSCTSFSGSTALGSVLSIRATALPCEEQICGRAAFQKLPGSSRAVSVFSPECSHRWVWAQPAGWQSNSSDPCPRHCRGAGVQWLFHFWHVAAGFHCSHFHYLKLKPLRAARAVKSPQSRQPTGFA